MRRAGITSDMMYIAGFGSILASVGTWALSMRTEKAGMHRADHWGIFVGEWAPTFFAVGVALRMEEEYGEEMPGERAERMKRRAREAMPVG
ncbi:hypothetical protein NE236_04370 [Actinoallomurus purpureus]|uniref:hypothetical protein n=1 Tax=Actinoallomurus purpureus TaxID=478114 RepID=UPI00209385F2|nr:hypothetical protein [Actinoallomurus purpureus]MCO6004206.1 hypothetical protein [Actinoallomurus purpureus]